MKRLLIRVAGYALCALAAWVFYVGWIVFATARLSGPSSLSTSIFAAVFLCVFGGFSAALILMTLVWILVVWIHCKVRLPGATYFVCAGTLLMVLIGCVSSSLSPKPLFVQNQTFFEGVLIALERQGVCLALAGTVIGSGYWFFAERKITDRHHHRRTSD